MTTLACSAAIPVVPSLTIQHISTRLAAAFCHSDPDRQHSPSLHA